MASGGLNGVLGIDTSCYTTSLAFVDIKGCVRAERRRILPVKQGERGLRQGDAFFLHGKQLPVLMEELFADLRSQAVSIHTKAVAVSVRPRPWEEAYLPVFRAGELVGRSLAVALDVPFIATSHQEGHIMAGLYSAPEAGVDQGSQSFQSSSFLVVHLSGGTTELLQVNPLDDGVGFHIEKMGGTTDLHAGQFVDRVGVALGLPFPAGPHLERLAMECDSEGETFPASVKRYDVSFSGAENQALRRIAAQASSPDVARGVERCLASTLDKILRKAVEETGTRQVLIVGGVAANTFLRARLRGRLEHRAVGAKLAFATPQLSGDNAVGVALLGWKTLSFPRVTVDRGEDQVVD